MRSHFAPYKMLMWALTFGTKHSLLMSPVHECFERCAVAAAGVDLCPTGPAEGGGQAGSLAADGGEGGGPSGHAGGVRHPVEHLSAPVAAQPEETHQGAPAECSPSAGGHPEVCCCFGCV